MVYMHYPQHLTDEEEMLVKRFAKLRKKKKALQALRAPKPEPEPQEKRSTPTSEEIKEQAKRLVKAGAIKISNETKKQSFKRKVTRDVEKVHTPASVGFRPFKDDVEDTPDVFPPSAKQAKTSNNAASKSSYESFIPESERLTEERFERNQERDNSGDRQRHRSVEYRDNDRKREDRPKLTPARRETRDYQKKGKTLYITGRNITENIIKEQFETFDKITNINMELDRNCGFVTYETIEGAERAIKEMDGSMLNGIYLRVSFARHQPNFDSATSGEPSKAAWSSIAASNSQKGSHKDKRNIVTYEEDIF